MKKLALVILLMVATEGLLEAAQWVRNDTGLDCSLYTEDLSGSEYLAPGRPVIIPTNYGNLKVICQRRDTTRGGAMFSEELGYIPQDGRNRRITCPWYDADCTYNKPQLNWAN